MVRLLRADGRITQEALAARVNLSRPAVHERLRRLEDQQVVQGYRALVDWTTLGLGTEAIIWIRTGARADFTATARAVLAAADEEAIVHGCHRMTGDWNMMATTHSASPEALQRLADRIGRLGYVEQTRTDIVLSSVYPLPDVAEH